MANPCARAIQALSRLPSLNPARTWTSVRCGRWYSGDASQGNLGSAQVHSMAARVDCDAARSPHDAAEVNRLRRIELAATYRAMEKCNLHEGVCNHITVMAPPAAGTGSDVMLLVPEGIYWSEVTPSCLLGLDDNNDVVEGEGTPELTALCIHRGVRLRHKHRAVLHAHSPYVTALGCLEDPTVRTMHQSNLLFHGRIAYDMDFNGFGIQDEGQRLCDQLGDKVAMMMGNHGYITVGDTMALALNRGYYLDRVCMFQMLAMSTGQPIRDIRPEVISASRDYLLETESFYADRLLHAYIRLFAKDCAEFEGYDFTRDRAHAEKYA